MVNVIVFCNDKHENFWKRYSEIKHIKTKDEELSFREVLDKAIKNRK